MTLVTRFAPSPTGSLHIGSARTALFNWLYAKRNNGKFFLRIEDTDKERSTQAAIDEIFRSMQWLGLDWDDEVVYQSKRQSRHQEIAHQMLESGNAYRCYASQEMIEKMREANPNKKFHSPWRDHPNTSAPQGASPVIRLKAETQQGSVTISDTVYGNITIPAEDLDDMVLLRSDGTPTYMLAVVVDDHDMGVNYVIRGEDHLTNTFRQNQIYRALNWNIPQYAHIPLIHASEGGKLSKRHGALGVTEYKKLGYLPEALCNYLVKLGWGHGDLEIATMQEVMKIFAIEDINKSPAKFNAEKLNHINAHYMQQMPISELTHLLNHEQNSNFTAEAVELFRPRASTLTELAESMALLLAPLKTLDERSANIMNSYGPALLKILISDLEQLQTWDIDGISNICNKFVEAHPEYKLSQVMQSLRASVARTFASPGIMEVMSIIGKQESIGRIRSCVDVRNK